MNIRKKRVIKAGRDSSFRTFDVTANGKVMDIDAKSFEDAARQVASWVEFGKNGSIITVADRRTGNTRSYEVIRKGAIRDVTGDTLEERQAIGASTSTKRKIVATKGITFDSAIDWIENKCPYNFTQKLDNNSGTLYYFDDADGTRVASVIVSDGGTNVHDRTGRTIKVRSLVKLERVLDELIGESHEITSSTKRKRTIKAASNRNDFIRKLNKVYQAYMAIETDADLRKSGMTHAEWEALPAVFKKLQADGWAQTVMSGLADFFKKNGFSIHMDKNNVNYIIVAADEYVPASTSIKRKFTVKASKIDDFKKAWTHDIFLKDAPAGYKKIRVYFKNGDSVDYTTNSIEDYIGDRDILAIVDAETGELLYEHEHGVMTATSAKRKFTVKASEDLSGTYYITYNGNIIAETDGTGDAGEEALGEIFSMHEDALAAAIEYLNSFGDPIVDDDEVDDASRVARILAQFISMEYDEAEFDPSYFGSEISWDGGRIEWFDSADLAESNNVDEWIENTDLSAEDLDIDSAQAVKCAYDPTDENAKYDATFTVESYYDDRFYVLEDTMSTDDWSEVEEWAHEHLMRGGNIRIDSKYGILEVTADEYNDVWENYDVAGFDINDEIAEYKQRIVNGSQSVKCSESIMAYVGDEVDTGEIKDALRAAGVREWGVEKSRHHGKNGFEDSYRICVDDVTGDFEAVVNALEAAGFSAKFLELYGNWLEFSISDTREEPKYCYRVSYDYTSDIVPMDDSTTDYQSIIDALIDQMESEGNTGYLYTLDEVEEEGWNEDEYVIGGNHGLALYHGGNLHIEDLGMMKPSEAVNSSTSIQAEHTTLRDRDITSADDVRELVLYITNDGDLYRQRTTPIIENLKRKVKKGNYDRELAVKAWQYLADDGVRKYDKEFGSGRGSLTLLDKATREEIARELRDYYEEEVMWDVNHPESSDDLTTV